MSNPFDYVDSINNKKNNMMRCTENDELAEKEYNPWIVNTALSNFPDTILHVNEINQHHDIPKRAQYEFLLNSIRRKKRYASWAKKPKNDDILEMVMEYYTVNVHRAREYLSLMSDEQIVELRSQFATGGKT